jgi:hypothetical protein
VDTGRPDTGQPDRRTRTTEPLSGHQMVDADRRPTPWLASWPCRPRRPRPTAGCRLDAPPGAAAVWATDQPGQLGSRTTGTARPPPGQSAAGATPPSSWRLGALLSSDDYGSSVEREAHGQVLWQARRGPLREPAENAVRWGSETSCRCSQLLNYEHVDDGEDDLDDPGAWARLTQGQAGRRPLGRMGNSRLHPLTPYSLLHKRFWSGCSCGTAGRPELAMSAFATSGWCGPSNVVDLQQVGIRQ